VQPDNGVNPDNGVDKLTDDEGSRMWNKVDLSGYVGTDQFFSTP